MRIHSNLALVGDLQMGLSGPWDCHVWAIRAPGGVILIDSGSGTHGDTILDNVEAAFGAREVAAVVLTHAHPDHAAGAAWFRETTGCTVYAPEPSRAAIESGDEELTGLAAAKQSGVYPPEIRFEPCPVERSIAHDEQIEIAGQSLHAIHVRGHSPDAFCYLTEFDGRRTLFAGDVVFYGGVLGVVNAPGSGMEGYRADLDRLANRGVDALLPGHGMFTLRNGQQHIDAAIEAARGNPMPRQIGQWDRIF